MQVLAYVRVSSEEQAHSRAGIEAQRATIEAEAKRRGWTIIDVIEDAGFSAKDLRRPGIRRAIEVLESGAARALVVSKLDRLSRSMVDFAGLMAKAQKQSWGIVALDVAVDTTTPSGEAMANVMAAFAQFERRLIGQRTKEALAEKRKQGVRLGRPRSLPAAVVRRIEREHKQKRPLRQIAAGLNADGVPTAQGGKQWYAGTVRAVLQSRAAAA